MENSFKQHLKKEAKNHKSTMGVLAVKNIINGRVYIQSSLTVEALVNRLKFTLNSGQFTNVELQKDWIMYGESVFLFETIIEIEPQENAFVNYRQEITKAEKSAKQEQGLTADLY